MEIINEIEFTSDIWCVVLPIILCLVDVATGYVNAWKKDKISSKKMREGLGKKFGEITLCFLGWITYLAFSIKIAPTFTAIYVGVMELTSIAENLDKLGVPIPIFISKKLNNIKDDIKGDDK